jgi:ribosomal protein L31E
LQSHIYIIVSRKDKTQRLKLSPTCNEKLTKRTIGDNEYQVGFDRVKWINMAEKTFDEHFKYSRKELEKFINQNILKNGSPQEKFELNKLIATSQNNTRQAQKKSIGIY